jgi:hypothetical protein
MPGAFVGFFILVVIIGVGTTIYRVSMARDIARRAGMDPNDAAAATLLTENGLDATYLAASLRSGQHDVPAPRTTESRLQELKSLLDRGLVNQAEYDQRRAEILAEISPLLRQLDATVVVERPVRVVRNLPQVTLGVGEVARVPAPVGFDPRFRQRAAGIDGCIDDRVDLSR